MNPLLLKIFLINITSSFVLYAHSLNRFRFLLDKMLLIDEERTLASLDKFDELAVTIILHIKVWLFDENPAGKTVKQCPTFIISSFIYHFF